jgi:hypothetical protein
MRLLFIISALICWLIAVLMLDTMDAVHFRGAEDNAKKNRELIKEFEPKVQLVEQYLAKEKRLPTYAELNGCSPKPYDMCGVYDVSNIRPTDLDFQFPAWQPNSKNYVIGYWRGEWSEYYDSASKSFSMEHMTQASDWRKGWEYEALWVLGFILLPWIICRLALVVKDFFVSSRRVH